MMLEVQDQKIPTQLFMVPVRDGDKLTGVIAASYDQTKGFSSLFSSMRTGRSSEVYAVCLPHGHLLSRSRFFGELADLGFVPKGVESAVLRIQIRDPGRRLQMGDAVSDETRAAWPFTLPAEAVMKGGNGIDLKGHRDYRGELSFAAWRCLPEYGIGIISEVDVAEAIRPLTILRLAFGALMLLLAAVGLAVALAMRMNTMLARKAANAQLKIEELGQYKLQRKIGEGGMGSVYLATHQLLRRPTAIKLITSQVGPEATARFEREVTTCSQLTHPNTISIYDFGHNSDGVFFYAMEYLEGLDLDDIVKRFGPLPPGRVIHVLRQVCGSLAEAHKAGLIHRDIKPANIFLCNRGGIPDFVKVLDFGLAKQAGSGSQQLTMANAISGTPGYISPEIVNQAPLVDGRSDLYSLACVAYFMLTRKPLFKSEKTLEILMAHANHVPPTGRELGTPIPEDLEMVLRKCLEKEPAQRYPDAESFSEALRLCRDAGSWTDADAKNWWYAHPVETKDKTMPTVPTNEQMFTVQIDSVQTKDSIQ